jgi:hypothetical protein
MKKLSSRLIILLVVFLLSFNIVTDFKRQEVKASALAGTIGGITLGGLGEGAASAIVLGGPYVAAFAVVCIGAGIVYKNREEIGAGLTHAYNYAQSLGKNLVDFFETDANGNVTVKSEGVDLIRGSVKNYLADPVAISGHIGDFDIAKEISSTKPSITNINFPVSESDTLILNIKSNFNTSGDADFLVNGTSVGWLGNILNSTSYPNGMYVYLSYDSTGFKYGQSLTSVDALMKSVIKSYDSVCADFSINVKNRRSLTGSISVDRLLGNSIGDSTSVDADVTFKNPALELDRDISVSIPTDLTWDKVIDKTWDNTLDATNSDTIPGEGTGGGDLTLPTTSLDLSPLYLDLSKKFPFCIPWDIYNLVKSFEVSKKRPVYNADLDLKILGKYSFDIDFAFFDDYFPFSSILRYFLLIAFIYALIVNTRKHIGG